MKFCRGSIPVNAVEQDVFLLPYNKQTSEFHLFISYPKSWQVGQRCSESHTDPSVGTQG